jgi:hypothetical protein
MDRVAKRRTTANVARRRFAAACRHTSLRSGNVPEDANAFAARDCKPHRAEWRDYLAPVQRFDDVEGTRPGEAGCILMTSTVLIPGKASKTAKELEAALTSALQAHPECQGSRCQLTALGNSQALPTDAEFAGTWAHGSPKNARVHSANTHPEALRLAARLIWIARANATNHPRFH